MASDPLRILLHWFSFDVDRGSGFHLFGDFILSFLPPSRLLLPLLSTPTPGRLPPGASAVIQLPSRWWYSSLPECQMFLDRNKLHFFMAYGKLPWLLLLLYPLCELNMYSVACCLQCYCRVTYGTDSIRMKLALDNPLITWILTGSSSASPLRCRFALSVIIATTLDAGWGLGRGLAVGFWERRLLRQTERIKGLVGKEYKGLYACLWN